MISLSNKISMAHLNQVLFFCCGLQKKNRKERESLAALMQDPRCPERTVLPSEAGPNYAELVHYSIVLDVKSTV